MGKLYTVKEVSAMMGWHKRKTERMAVKYGVQKFGRDYAFSDEDVKKLKGEQK